MVVIGDAVVNGIINKLLEMGLEYMVEQKEWQTGMKSELGRLQNTLPHIQAVVDAAESGQLEITGPLWDWLQQLKDALYDAEDVLEELDYPRLQQLAEGPTAEGDSNSKCKRKVGDLLYHSTKKLVTVGKRAIKADPMLKALREAVKRMDEVAAHVGEFLQLLSIATIQQQLKNQMVADNRETGSLLTEDKMFGRDQKREELLAWLMSTTNCFTDVEDGDGGGRMNLSLASLVGHGGMGKTTLAQSVFGDKRIQDHFDLMIWVCVSNNFDVKALTRSMLESAMGRRQEVESLAVLQDDLRKRLLLSNRVLVVLDDAWNDNNVDSWANLLTPLKHGSPKGSKILLTSRMMSVVDAGEKALRGSLVEDPARFHLTRLPKADFLSLFNWHAFGGIYPDDHPKLQPIGKKIAAKLGGLPLAAKVVGRMLNSQMREEYWETILNNNISKFEEGERGIMSVLRLSYHHLSKHLRPCFTYCSLFPQNSWFTKDNLVSRWMAVGLVQQSTLNPSEAPEDIGGRYIDDLLKRSFLEPHPSQKETYIMHDLLHELAESVSAGEIFRFEGDMSCGEIPKSVRHLYFRTNDLNHLKLLAAADHLERLRSLHLKFDGEGAEQGKLLRKILCSVRRVRVLMIGCKGEIPDEISKLKHLKFLQALTRLEYLPAFRNYNLQHLCIDAVNGDSYSFRHSFRQSVKNLICLRHYKPREVELDVVRKLTSLQELDFFVGESEFEIGELKDLNQLRELKISQLENVRSLNEARAAELGKKEHLYQLELTWGQGYRDLDLSNLHPESEELVLDGLRPHSRVSKLIIEGYGGTRSANWMRAEFVENLQFISLKDCKNWEHLPHLQRLPYLKHLSLCRMPAVKQLYCFQQLEVLEIKNLLNWEGLCGLAALDGQCFPRLHKLKLSNCPRLKVLPPLPLGLIELDLHDVGLLALPELVPCRRGNDNSSSCSISTSSSTSSSLSKLCISQCQKLTSARALLQHRHPMLRYLEIIPPKALSVEGYGELVGSLPSLLQGACLHDLRLGCGSIMTSLPSQGVWGSLSSLKYLHIEGCGTLSSLEPLKALRCRLAWLEISNCPLLVQAASTAAMPISMEENCGFQVDAFGIDDPLLLLTEPLRDLNSVRGLMIRNCSQLESMTKAGPWLLQNRTSLQSLSLFNTSSLQSLPADFQLLSSLRYLHLEGAGQLQSLPQLPLSLTQLWILSCNETLRERCRKDEGADWPNIKHISDMYLIDYPPRFSR